jgi:hypothetical protein
MLYDGFYMRLLETDHNHTSLLLLVRELQLQQEGYTQKQILALPQIAYLCATALRSPSGCMRFFLDLEGAAKGHSGTSTKRAALRPTIGPSGFSKTIV